VDDRHLVIIVPMLGRLHRIHPLLESIKAATPRAQVVFGCTPSDRKVIQTLERAGQELFTVAHHSTGDYARKINTGYRLTKRPLIFLGADDLHFHPGWLEAAIAELAPGIGVVGTNDLGSPRVTAGLHATHSLVTRAYADRYGSLERPGEILFEGYVHEYVDDELVGTAKARSSWAFAKDSHVEHLHPNWHKAPRDPLYDRQWARMRKSKSLYLQRRRLWES
jgi:hypothetical protein